MLTAQAGVPSALRAMKDGAWDYLEQPCSTERLIEVLTRALSHRKVVLKSRRIERVLLRNDPAAVSFPGSGKISDGLCNALRSAALSNEHVYLWGAAGAGKRQAAFVLNQLSPEPRPVVRIDLAGAQAVPHLEDGPVDLICRNAEAAPSAVIAELSVLAANHENVRVITMSRSPLDAQVWHGAHGRESSAEIRVPTLADRSEDLIEIFEMLLRQVVRMLNIDMLAVPEAVAADVLNKTWPGNLLELRNYAMSFALSSQAQQSARPGQSLAEQVEAFEKLVIGETLRRMNGNAAEAAKALGLPRNTFYDRLNRYSLSAKDFRSASER